MSTEPDTNAVNVHSKAAGSAALLSNFAHTPFVLDGEKCESMEGFIQGLKVADVAKQRQILAQHGYQAKRASTSERNRQAWETQTLWWRGDAIVFRSAEHFALVKRALAAKFSKNRTASEALLATGDATLIHETGIAESPHTSLPAATFVALLTELRRELRECGSPG